MSTPSPAASPEPSPAPAARRRWPRVLLVVLLLLIALLFLAPALAAPWVTGLIVDEANARLDGRLGVADLSFGWGGGLLVSDLSVADRDGAPVLALRRLDAQVNLLSALSGRYEATVRAEGLRVHVQREESGALNVQTLPRRAEPPPGRAPPPVDAGPPDVDMSGPLPDVHVDLQLTDAQLLVHDGDRTTTLDDLRFSLKLDGLQQPAPFELQTNITGPDGPGGSLQLRGQVTLAAGGRLSPDGLRARLDLLVQDVLLAALQPAAAALAGVQRLEGTLSGSGAWTITGPRTLDGRTELRLAGLRAEGGPLAQPLVVPDAHCLLEAAADEQGSGRQRLELVAGEMLALRWVGKTERLAMPDGSVTGELSLDAQLGPTLAAARDALPLQPGLDVEGQLKLLARTTLALRDGAPGAGELDLELRLPELAVRDAGGAPLDLDALRDANLLARASFDAAAGSVRLERFVLQAGPVYAKASGEVGGLPRAGETLQASGLALSPSELLLEADLDALGALLGRVVDLGGLSPTGKVHLASSLSGTGQRLAATAALDLSNVHVSGAGVDDLQPVDLHLRHRGTLDLAPGGRSEIEELTLVANALDLRVTGGLTDVLDAARREGTLETKLDLHTMGLSQLVRPLLDGLVLAGEEARVQGVLGLHGPALSWSGELDAPSLGAAGGALGPDPVQVAGLHVVLDVEVPGDGQPLRVQRLQLASTGGFAAGQELPPLALDAAGLTLDGTAGTLQVTQLGLQAPGVQLQGAVQARGLVASGPEALAVDGTATLVLQPAEVSARWGALLGGLALTGDALTTTLQAASAGGRLTASAALRGGPLGVDLPATEDRAPQSLATSALALDLKLGREGDRWALGADATLTDLQASLAGATPLHVADPELRLGLDADLEPAALDVTLRRAEVASTIVTGAASGRLVGLAGETPVADGLRGQFRYVPDRLAALLGPLLPVRLSGSREEQLEFTLDGPLAGADLREQLAGLTLQARLGTGTLDLPGLQLGGTTTVSAADGTLRLGGELLANGGTLGLDGTFDLRRAVAGVSAPASQVKLSLARVRAGGELGRALAACHPLFASAKGQVGQLDATMDAGLALAWNGELPLEALLAGAAPPSLAPLTGSLDLQLGEVKLAGSPLLSELLVALGRPEQPSMTVDRLAIAVEDGRLRYVEPWDVRLAGVDTSFGGSVGLDGTLDLVWSVPVTAELVHKHGFLRSLQGQPIAIPLGGRVDAPKLRWNDALADLAEKAALQEVKEGLAGKLGGLGGLAGGKDDDGGAPANDPEQILKQADALWEAGKPDEARPHYKRLKDDFKLTLTYVLNKDRIDTRAKKSK